MNTVAGSLEVVTVGADSLDVGQGYQNNCSTTKKPGP